MKKQDNKNLEAVSDIRPSLIDETTGSIFAYKLLYIGIFTLPKRRVDMLSLYGILFGLGMLLALLTLLFGEVLGHLLSGLDSLFSHSLPFLQPVILIGGITILGGTGLLLERYTSLDALPVFLLSLLMTLLLSIALYFLYVRPMKNSETSIAFSIFDLQGSIGEVLVPIPAFGYGEVLLKAGGGVTNQIAASFDRKEIAGGTKVVVVEIREGVLYLSPLD